MTTTWQGLNVSGRVIEAGDPEYDAARATFYGGVDKHPRAIVRVANAEDVAAVLAYAGASGVELAVRSGGHSVVGHCVSEGGIVLDLHDLRAIDLDVPGRTAWADAGVTAVEFSKAAGAHGLGLSFGDTGSVGLGGLVVGGGVGYLVRKYGLTIDSLIAAEVVTADGKLRRVDAEHEPELFWALRGGGGNFGVVTRFKLRLHQVDPFVGGLLMQPASAEVVHSFVALSEAAPDELSTIANVMPAPPMPFVPTEWHGKLVVMSFIAYAGAPKDAERAIAPLRALAKPIADMVKPMPYADIYPPEDASYHPIAIGRTLLVDAIDRRSADSIMAHLGASKAYFSVAQLRVLGGAMARVPSHSTAFAHRKRRLLVNVAALVNDAAELPAHTGWVEGFARDLQRGPVGAYVNFLTDEGDERVRSAYPGGAYERLAAIKRRYDPTNLFRLNQNIRPSA